jgi:hypothetical protein
MKNKTDRLIKKVFFIADEFRVRNIRTLKTTLLSYEDFILVVNTFIHKKSAQ